MRNVTDSVRSASPSARSYAPSVPLSVYRELAAEMQANQETMDFLKAQNQQLVQQNQQLRQEIQKLVSSAIHLQKVAESFELKSKPVTPEVIVPKPIEFTQPELVVPPPPPPPPPPPQAPIFPPQSVPMETLVTEQEEGRYRQPMPPENLSELHGVWLAVALFLVGVVAFGATFAILRPILLKR